ncbi:SDR family oxidoreductase [Cognatishimia activa]|uniref:2-(R)-hydroxypropyl-CoM dehydrogenase n=1 Tax=Cognatishimia activa TaxID=1715691 RepID=A0A0P1IPN9_9RHOB|nr:SDR family oxidoreductase [Cognatishimia activa]CUI86432.1 2-(R)-hydroxypropyl-CoM dehydrogenase [Cognatishimia activa]CUK25582.1 2-(R)-hydroxypropyl-CoM dehydrogenase [Cognatishimia activa]
MRLSPDEGIAVVTGGGSGLGRALVIELSRAGFTVVAIGRRLPAIEETASLAPGSVLPVQLDVADASAVTSAFEKIIEEHGPIALLINNAAVYPQQDILDETTESYFETQNVNFGGVVACSLAALKDMTERGKGRILNVATFADLNPLPGASAYSVSKGAARIFTRALIADLSDRFPGIVINDWMPGMLATEMGIPNGLAPDAAAKWGAELAQRMEPSYTGATFEMDTEILPPRGLKQKLKDRLFMRARAPRRLS